MQAISIFPWLSQQDPVSDNEIRNEIEEILEDPVFDYSDSLWQRFLDWLAEFFRDTEVETPTQQPSFLGGIGPILSWIFILLAIAAVIFLLVYVIKNYVGNPRVKRAKKEDPLVEHRRSVSDWQALARDLESQGEWKLALRARFRELVRTLIDRRQLPDIAGLTTGELRERLNTTTPDAEHQFDEISSLFEWGWYGRRTVKEHDVTRLVDLSQIVLNARVETPIDRVEIEDFGEIGLLDIEPDLDPLELDDPNTTVEVLK